MDLKKRLARFDRPLGSEAAADGREPLAGAAGADPADLGFRPLETGAGTTWMREEILTSVAQPSLPGESAAGGGMAALLTGKVPSGVEASDLLLLDTETTGLAGGTGTVAFLVGLASWAADGSFRLRQLFLPSPGGEPALMAALADEVAPYRVVVTYNGNGYDLPLLRTRGILARRRLLPASIASWDLLPAARRLWGRRLDDCRQGTVEAAVAPVGRDGEDLDGSRIPGVWFAYVRRGENAEMEAVLRHNRWDMLGMAAILRRVAGVASSLDRPASAPVAEWRDAWARARICENAGLRAVAADWARAAWAAADRDAAVAGDIFPRDAVRLLKRVGHWERVLEVLDAVLARRGADWAHREAAILWEHRLGRLDLALAHARSLGDGRRIERIEARMARSRCGGPSDLAGGAHRA